MVYACPVYMVRWLGPHAGVKGLGIKNVVLVILLVGGGREGRGYSIFLFYVSNNSCGILPNIINQ